MVSNALVHLDVSKVSGAWQFYNDRDSMRRVTQPLEHQDHSHYFYCISQTAQGEVKPQNTGEMGHGTC